MQWLSAAADDPEMCRAAWADDARKPYALATGRLFDVVVVNQRVGLESFDQMERRQMPMGPVMADWGSKQVGFFLPSASSERFAHLLAVETNSPPHYKYLTHGGHVVVPGPMTLSGDRYEWLRAPVRRPEWSALRAAALAAMLVAASLLISRADRYGEESRSMAEGERAGEEVPRGQ